MPVIGCIRCTLAIRNELFKLYSLSKHYAIASIAHSLTSLTMIFNVMVNYPFQDLKRGCHEK